MASGGGPASQEEGEQADLSDFLWGNVNEKGKLEAEYLDKVGVRALWWLRWHCCVAARRRSVCACA
jgi:hypothetical protein